MKVFNRKVYNKDLNFIPERILVRARRRRRNVLTVPALLIIASLAVAVYRIPENMATSCRENIDKVNRNIVQLEKAAPVYEELEQIKQEYRVKQEAMKRIEEEDYNFIDLLGQISLALPAGVYISSLKYQAGETLELGILARNPVETARVVVALRNTDLFAEVTLQGKEVPLMPVNEPISFSLTFKGAVEEAGGGQQAEENTGEKNVAERIKDEIHDKLNIKVE